MKRRSGNRKKKAKKGKGKKEKSRRRAETRPQAESVRKALVDLHRRGDADGPPVVHLRELVRRFGDPGAALAEILARDADEDVSEYALMMLFLAAEDPGVPARTKERIGKSVVPVLLGAMRDPAVPDERKYSVGPVLDLFGAGLPDDEYRACFREFERTATEMRRRKLREVTIDIESVEHALVMQHLVRHDAPADPSDEDFAATLSTGIEMCEDSPDAGAALVATAAAIAVEYGSLGEHLLAVVERLADLRTRRAAWFLRELGMLPRAGVVGGRSRELARELALSGVAPDPPPAGDFTHGLVSTVDGSGSRTLMLFYRTAEGNLDALALLLNDLVGVKDVWCVFGDAADLDQDVRSRSDGQVSYAPCDLGFARDVVADALAVHKESGRPFPGRFLLYRHYLGAEPLAAARRAPNLGAYMPETFVRGPGLVEGTARAYEHPIYGRLWSGSDEAYDFVRRFLPRGRGKKPRGPVALAMPESAFEEFVAKVASKERKALARRIAVNLEVEALAGRASKPASRAAARVWIALTEGVAPFEEVPFVRLLCTQAVSAIFTNLMRGHESQEEANRAALDLDMEAAKGESGPPDRDW